VEIRRAGTEIKSPMTAPAYTLNRTRDSLVRLFACILLFFSFRVNASSPHVLCRIELAFLFYFMLANDMSMHDVLRLVLQMSIFSVHQVVSVTRQQSVAGSKPAQQSSSLHHALSSWMDPSRSISSSHDQLAPEKIGNLGWCGFKTCLITP